MVGAFIAGLLTGGVIGTVFMGLFQITKAARKSLFSVPLQAVWRNRIILKNTE